MNPESISCCLLTKDPLYPLEIMERILFVGFGEILILANSSSPHFKQELFEKAKFEHVFYQDDDCIPPIQQLLELSDPNKINCAMKRGHLQHYAKSRIALLGWGSVFPKSCIKVLDYYRAEYGEDEIYRRETERIMTWFNFPQNRFELPIVDLPSAYAPDRLSNQPGHYENIKIVEQRCALIEQKRLAVTV